MISIEERITLEEIERARSEWRDISHLFSGWDETSDNYGGVELMPCFLLTAQLGKWTGHIQLFTDGRYYGQWEQWSRPFGLYPNAIYCFEALPSLQELIGRMEQWIDVRRNPSTWHGEMSEDARRVLDMAK